MDKSKEAVPVEISNSRDTVILADPQNLNIWNNERVDLASQAPLHHPLTLIVEPTNKCNFSCIYCPHNLPEYKERADGLRDMDLENFKMLVDHLITWAGEWALKDLNLLFMGEPLLHKEISEFVRYANQRRVAQRIRIISNGTLLTREASTKLLDAGLTFLRISIYGGFDSTQLQRSNNKVKLDKIADNLKQFIELRENYEKKTFIQISMIDTNDEEENEAYLKRFTGLGDEVKIEKSHNWADHDEGLSRSENEKVLGSANFPFANKRACAFPFYTLAVHADLKVSLCCIDWDRTLIVGDLKEETLQEIWMGKRLKKMLRMHLEGRRKEIPGCKDCTFLFVRPDSVDSITPEEFDKRWEERSKLIFKT